MTKRCPAPVVATIAYHGTPHVEAVLKEGLRAACSSDSCKHIWLAKSPQECSPSWGTILEVNVEGLGVRFSDDPQDGWQFCYHGGDIPPERIRRYVG